MQLSSIIACLATVASVTAQAIQFTSYPEEVKAGETYTIQWSPSDIKDVTLVLRSGDPNNLNTGSILASNLANTNSFQWTVSPTLFNNKAGEEDTDYAFEIRYKNNGEDESNYTGSIAVEGGRDFTGASTNSDDEDTTSTITETTDMTTTMTTTASDSSATDDESTSTDEETTTTTTTTARRTIPTDDEEEEEEPTPSAPSGGAAVARSSSLAMVFCILAAVVYLN